MPPRQPPAFFILTRLHARYGKGGMKDDLVFRTASAVMGGREVRSGPNGTLEEGAKPSGVNNFQARYAIRHEWTGPMECANPRRGIWGGPPRGVAGSSSPKPALDVAFAARDAKLPTMIAQDIPELKVIAAAPLAPSPAPAGGPEGAKATEKPKKKSGCGCGATGTREGLGVAVLLLLTTVILRRRRRYA